MTVCTIIYNSGSGSDTAASGSNAPTTAITDDGRSSTTNAGQTIATATSTTLTFAAAVDLTGVLDDGTDVIHVQTSSGSIHFHRITTFTGGVSACTALVVSPASDVTESALAWSIGGKRATLDNDTTNSDLEDALAGWRYELEAGTYPVGQSTNLPSNVGDTTDGDMQLVAASGASPTITWTGDFSCLITGLSTHILIRDVNFSNTVSTHGATRALYCNTSNGYLHWIGGSVDVSGPCIEANGTLYGSVIRANLESTGAAGIWLKGRSNLTIAACHIHDCGTMGVHLAASTGIAGSTVIGNKIVDCTQEGIRSNAGNVNNKHTIAYNTCHSNGVSTASSNIQFSGTLTATQMAAVYNNVLTDSGAYGIEVNSTAGGDMALFNDYNFFRGNSSGEVSNVTKGPNSVTLTADPYTDESTNDLTLNDTAGGGAAVKNAGLGVA